MYDLRLSNLEQLPFYEPSQIRTRSQCFIDSNSSLNEQERIQLMFTFRDNIVYHKNQWFISQVYKNHWYNCRNGHLYYVGDCGTPTVETECPECGEKIGTINDDGKIKDKEDVAMKLTYEKLRQLEKRRKSLDRKRKLRLQKQRRATMRTQTFRCRRKLQFPE